MQTYLQSLWQDGPTVDNRTMELADIKARGLLNSSGAAQAGSAPSPCRGARTADTQR